MKKKILSGLLSLALVFGSVAALPKNMFTDSTSITVSASQEGVDGDWNYWVDDEGKTYITKYTGNKTEVTIPAKVGGRKVDIVAIDVLRENKTVTSVVVSEGIEEIQDYFCADCPKLKEVTLPNGLKIIGSSAFSGSPELAQVNIPLSVKYVGSHILTSTKLVENLQKKNPIIVHDGVLISGESCKGNITIPSSVRIICGWSFYGNKDITSVTIPNGVKMIGESAFSNCPNLTKVSIPGSVENFGSGCFSSCPKLKDLTFANGIKRLDGYCMFYCCTALETLNFPDSLETIGSDAFNGCTGLKTVNFGKGLQHIGDLAFAGCISLKSVVLPSSTKSLGAAFMNCTGLTSVTLNEGLEVIGAGAFCDCSSLKSILIPKSVKEIGNSDSIHPPFGKLGDDTAYIENFVCYKGTAGEDYAKKKGFKYTAVLETSRLAGDNRYATAAEIAKKAYPSGAKTVILASGMTYADALVGVPLATKLNAPILLAAKDSLPRETTNALEKLGAKKVIILGGKGAVSEQVETTLKNQGITTERYEGGTRFGTATAIAEKLNENPTDVFFVYYNGFPDALSASTAAALKNAPIIYLTTDGDMNADTAAYLAKLKKAGSVKNAYIIGGTGVITDNMLKKVGTALGVTPKRLDGKDRYETCVAVNNEFKSLLSGKSICVATGADYPDALAGGVFAAIQKAPLFLINGKAQNLILSDKQKAYLKTLTPNMMYVLGGIGVVPDSHVKTVADAWG